MAFPDNEQLKRLLAAVARQDRQSFEQLYTATAPKLLGYAMRVLRQQEIAEEVLQESFVNIWSHAADYQSSLAAPLTWMTSIVRNKALDFLRSPNELTSTQHNSLEDPDMQDLMLSLESAALKPADALQFSQEALALARCLQRLDGAQRQAIAMAFYHDLTHGEVASQLNLPLGTVKTWIRRGLSSLHGCMSKLGGV
nr:MULTISPECIES: sigma-70 family RNA polymerase sigma factor [unclassified Herbaspirillum]